MCIYICMNASGDVVLLYDSIVSVFGDTARTVRLFA